MGSSNGKIDLENIEIEQVEQFYNWLQGISCPKELITDTKLNLTDDQAFSIIYYLQEIFEVIPDKFEKCKDCGCLYDSEAEGTSIDKDSTWENEAGEEEHFDKSQYGLYCDNCRID